MKKRVNITLSEEAVEEVKKYALEHHSTVSATIEQLVWRCLQKDTNQQSGWDNKM